MKPEKHKKGCRCGSNAKVLKPDHPWFVNSIKYHNCFWTYIKANPEPHTLKQVAELLNLKVPATASIEKRAISKLKKILKKSAYR